MVMLAMLTSAVWCRHNLFLLCFHSSLLDVFSEPAKSLLCRDSNEMTLNLVFEYVAQDLAQHIEVSGSTAAFSDPYIKVINPVVVL